MSEAIFTITHGTDSPKPISWDDVFVILAAGLPIAQLDDEDLETLQSLLVLRLSDVDVLQQIRMDDDI